MSGRNRLCLLVTKVKSLSILKTVHLLSGAAALLLSIVPSLRADALPWLQQPDSLYLAFTGLASPGPGGFSFAPLNPGFT